MKNTSYEAMINYRLLDPHKRASLAAAATTSKWLEGMGPGYAVVEWTRGESAFVIETPSCYIGTVIEGLGTKALVADGLNAVAGEFERITGITHYEKPAICNAAMAFNDLITLGVPPLVYNQYLAVGSGDWFKDEKRSRDLIEGTRKACAMAHCVWGGGETPTLGGVILPGVVDLAGSCFGIVTDKSQLINPARISAGDAIVMIESSGIHANGLSKAREIAGNLPRGYLTDIPGGRTYGEELLTATHIYVQLIKECLKQGIEIHYTVNITGHGWRKLMRANQAFSYVINHLPPVQPIFDFIREHGEVTIRDMYATFNMGAGFALYVREEDVSVVIAIARMLGFNAWRAGEIQAGEKKVIIEPLDITFNKEELEVR